MDALRYMFLAFLLGVQMTLLYDTIRVFRRVVRHNNFLTGIEDIGFWIFCAVRVFQLMNAEGEGKLRWFAIMAALAGIFLFERIIGAFYVKNFSKILQRSGKMLCSAYFCLKNGLTRFLKMFRIYLRR